MATTIVLAPGADTLADAVAQAAQTGALLLLEPGTHFTRPGVDQKTRVGAKGLRIRAAAGATAAPNARPTIKRPDGSIDSAAAVDDNYGLYFEPEPPSDAEVAALTWKRHTPQKGNDFEYAVVMRGSIDIRDVRVDCNMSAQGLDAFNSADVEHNAMLAFSGTFYDLKGTAPSGLKRRVYVGFNKVTLQNIGLTGGAFSDDIWFARGYFHPNIGQVTLKGITAPRNVQRKRATVSFSGLSQKISVQDADIFELHVEDTSGDNWRKRPRKETAFSQSIWTLKNVQADKISLSAKGQAYRVNAQNLVASKFFYASQGSGTIKASTLRLPTGEDRRMIGHLGLSFTQVTWQLGLTAAGELQGLKLMTGQGESCDVKFTSNRFVIDGNPIKGQLIDSGRLSNKDPSLQVNAQFKACTYPAQITATPNPSLKIAKIGSVSGQWKFSKADWAPLTVDQALTWGANANVTAAGGIVTVLVA